MILLIFLSIVFVLLVVYLIEVSTSLSVYGDQFSKFKQKYGYIKNPIECGHLLNDFMYSALKVNNREAKRYGRMYKLSYPFIKKPKQQIIYNLDDLKKKYGYESKDYFEDSILKIFKKKNIKL